MSTLFRSACALGAALALPAAPAAAAFITPSDWTRPANDPQALTTRTTYQEWNVFSSPGGPNDPDVAEVNPYPGIGLRPGKANVYDTSGGSFVTGSGNIYSPSVATQLDADVPADGLGSAFQTTVLFQIRALGAELNYGTVRLDYSDGAERTISYAERRELERVPLGGFGGSQVDTLFRFEIPFSPNAFKIEFDASGSSMSTDRVAVDTFATAVPEPASLGLLGVGALLLACRRRST